MQSEPVLLLVDRNRRNLELLTQFLHGAGFSSRPMQSLEEFDRALDQADDIGLALVDLSGFDASIWSRCERLREQKIPFIVLSPRQSVAIQYESIAHGAHGVLTKPLVTTELLGLIRSLLREPV